MISADGAGAEMARPKRRHRRTANTTVTVNNVVVAAPHGKLNLQATFGDKCGTLVKVGYHSQVTIAACNGNGTYFVDPGEHYVLVKFFDDHILSKLGAVGGGPKRFYFHEEDPSKIKLVGFATFAEDWDDRYAMNGGVDEEGRTAAKMWCLLAKDERQVWEHVADERNIAEGRHIARSILTVPVDSPPTTATMRPSPDHTLSAVVAEGEGNVEDLPLTVRFSQQLERASAVPLAPPSPASEAREGSKRRVAPDNQPRSSRSSPQRAAKAQKQEHTLGMEKAADVTPGGRETAAASRLFRAETEEAGEAAAILSAGQSEVKSSAQPVMVTNDKNGGPSGAAVLERKEKREKKEKQEKKEKREKRDKEDKREKRSSRHRSDRSATEVGTTH